MKIKFYNSQSNDMIVFELCNDNRILFLSSFFATRKKKGNILKITKKVQGADNVMCKLPVNFNDFSLLSVTYKQNVLTVYISGLKMWEGNIGEIDIDTIEKCAKGSTFYDELRIDDIARTDEEIMAFYLSSAPFFPRDKIKVIG